MKRGFLPFFFVVLTVLFAAALWMRLRSLGASASPAQATSASGERSIDPRSAASRGEEQAGQLVVSEESSGNGTSEASARERRYNELLRSSPPSPPTAPKERSLLDRVVDPIANALGMSRQPAQKPPPPAKAPPQPRSTPQQQRVSAAQEAANREKAEAEADPDTDVVPPQLLTAEFVPQQVQDGEQTVFAVIVNDNLSGVRSVSGVIASPSGSMQGFSCMREGETNRFIARVTVPKDAAEGVWAVKYMTLSDNASNSVNLNQAQGALPASAAFRVVSSGSDSSGPQLKAMWLDRQAMRAGEKNSLFVQADDDKVGVSLVSGVFVSPSRSARMGFGCRPGSEGVWECPLSPPGCLDCGLWRLEQVQLQDKANNLATFRADNAVVGQVLLDISGDRCDATAPVLTMLMLDPMVVSNAQTSTIRVQANVVDEGGCGTTSLSAQAVPPGGIGGQRQYVAFRQGAEGTFIGEITIPQFAAKGLWTIAWVQALDKGMNLRAYSANEPVVAGATFRVE